MEIKDFNWGRPRVVKAQGLSPKQRKVKLRFRKLARMLADSDGVEMTKN